MHILDKEMPLYLLSLFNKSVFPLFWMGKIFTLLKNIFSGSFDSHFRHSRIL